MPEQILPVFERHPCGPKPPAERVLEIMNPHVASSLGRALSAKTFVQGFDRPELWRSRRQCGGSSACASLCVHENTILKPMTLRFEAEALMGLRRADEAIDCLNRALHFAQSMEERWYEAEIYRLRAGAGGIAGTRRRYLGAPRAS